MRTREKRICALKGPKRSTRRASRFFPSTQTEMSSDNGTLSSASTSGGRQLPAGRASVCQPGGGGGWEQRESLEVRRPGNRWQNHLGGILDPAGVVCVAAVGPSACLRFLLNSDTRTSGVAGRGVHQSSGGCTASLCASPLVRRAQAQGAGC